MKLKVDITLETNIGRQRLQKEIDLTATLLQDNIENAQRIIERDLYGMFVAYYKKDEDAKAKLHESNEPEAIL